MDAHSAALTNGHRPIGRVKYRDVFHNPAGPAIHRTFVEIVQSVLPSNEPKVFAYERAPWLAV